MARAKPVQLASSVGGGWVISRSMDHGEVRSFLVAAHALAWHTARGEE
jgi:hypothetical protein